MLSGAAAKAECVNDSVPPAERTRSALISQADTIRMSADYWRRYKTSRTVGWTLAGVGGAATLFGVVGKLIDKSTNENYTSESSVHWNIVIFSGLGVTAASVPFFLSANSARKHVTSPQSTPVYVIMKDKPKKIKDDSYKRTTYWRRHNVYKACGWTSLGLGIAATGAGAVIGIVNGFTDNHKSSDNASNALVIGGLGLTAASVPMFILSYKNKYKAKEAVLNVSLNATSVQTVSPFGQTCAQPALGLCLSF